ncbi:hypothetical protein H072_8534 [Dactylellina haptotyla CBS 200.50]|uniref:L-ornithine N(5)-oxygenase n=1 Tax=Dactylellina haptotyla (strain CBS 200.50) TaxID=1284197 RepID=S8BR54_DACHA|nr:hypothetical protein H072_8534 [Dactylellina haptotyla CBS 200.50]
MASIPIGSSANSSDEFDLIIVGAGLYGLYTAKTFLELCPSMNLLIVDSLSSPGGVWAKERIYPGLYVQVLPQYFELPELRYEEVSGLEYNSRGFILGESWSKYFEAWVDKVGIREKIRFNTTVQNITRHEDGKWKCQISDTGEVLSASKLIIAIGITSVPRFPNIDTSKCTVPVLHQRYLGERKDDWQGEKQQVVTVYGAGKSSMDTLVQLRKAGKRVKWVIRKGGRGPPWLLDSNASSLIFTRFSGMVLPAMYPGTDGFARMHTFFKQTSIGRSLTSGFMGIAKTLTLANVGKISNDNLRQAIPEINPMWMYHVTAIDNYEVPVYDHLRDGTIEVIRDNIVSTEGDTITLESGEKFSTDAVIFATGWRTNFPFFSEELAMQLGLPSTACTEEFNKKWKDLETEADKRVFSTNPYLETAPVPPRIPPQEASPFRLYHHAVPTNPSFADGSIAILGSASVAATTHYVPVISLWTAVYMLGKMELPDTAEMEKAAAYELRFNQIRHVGITNDFPWISWDYMGVMSKLLTEMGMKPWLKGGFFGELFSMQTAHGFGVPSQKWIASASSPQ